MDRLAGEASVCAEAEERLAAQQAFKSAADRRALADEIAVALGMPFAQDGLSLIAALDRMIDAKITAMKTKSVPHG